MYRSTDYSSGVLSGPLAEQTLKVIRVDILLIIKGYFEGKFDSEKTERGTVPVSIYRPEPQADDSQWCRV